MIKNMKPKVIILDGKPLEDKYSDYTVINNPRDKNFLKTLQNKENLVILDKIVDKRAVNDYFEYFGYEVVNE
jgi:hypothetical protein